MQFKELIREKREGRSLDRASLESLLGSYLKGEVPDYQMAALLMAIFFRGMSWEETSYLTEIMWKSGETFPRRHRNDFWIDKHSTGGVGDKTSLLLVPLVTAVCRRLFGEGSVRVPMVSGRGLGHTGGTLDKLEAVPGFSTGLSVPRALELLERHGYFMMGQTPELAPLDRLLYALRDSTSTVESIPLIVSSIMSKKLSENLDGLVFDVKVGSGAFMKTESLARELIGGLCEVGRRQGVRSTAVLTSMDEPLGWTAGNALEVEECWSYLRGEAREAGLHEVTLALGAAMVSLAGRGKLSLGDAKGECAAELETAGPAKLFAEMFEHQGGDWKAFIDGRESARAGLLRFEAKAGRSGYVAKLDALALGVLVGDLGGGRSRKEDVVDPEVGLRCLKKVGAAVQEGETIAVVYYRSPAQEKTIANAWAAATELSAAPVTPGAWVKEVIQ